MKITLILCVEKGLLEKQALFFVKSIKKFFPFGVKIIALSPRKDFQPSKQTLGFFHKHGVEHINERLNTEYLDYPIANKVLACEFIETYYPEFNNLIFVDTDTVFFNPFNSQLVSAKNKLYLRPVDNQGPGSLGRGDENDRFWQDVFALFAMAPPSPNMTTTVRPQSIRPYYNAGFIWVNGISGFFAQWKKDFVEIVASDLRPFGYKSRDNTDFRCLDQVALAVTAHRFKESIEILPQTYNYPIPFRPILKDRPNHPRFDELVHVHYHKWFQHPGFLDYITDEEEKKSEQYLWLKEHLPLLPTIDGSFKC